MTTGKPRPIFIAPDVKSMPSEGVQCPRCGTRLTLRAGRPFLRLSPAAAECDECEGSICRLLREEEVGR